MTHQWNKQAGEPEYITRHRAIMVAHFVSLRAFDKEYAQYALKAYEEYPCCACPDIRQDVLAAWKASKL